jgi:hypothetical protein
VHVTGPTVSPDLPDGASRWPHRVTDLKPFSLVDAAASVSAHNDRIAITLVNRGTDEPEPAEVLLRDYAFSGPATIRMVTAGPRRTRTLPDVEAADMAEGSAETRDGTVALTLPPRSFTVIEAAITSR